MKLAIAFPLALALGFFAHPMNAQTPGLIPAGSPLCYWNGIMAPCPPSYIPRDRERRDEGHWHNDEERQRHYERGKASTCTSTDSPMCNGACRRQPWKCQ